MSKALDLFCGVGGAGRGLKLAGFHVTGIDIQEQPLYPGDMFIKADAMEFPLHGFDFIWASPPCQKFTQLNHGLNKSTTDYPDLIGLTRQRLIDSGALWVIENVEQSTLNDCFVLCGSMFGLGVTINDRWYQLRRHRWFESPMRLLVPPCSHSNPCIGIYGDHARDRSSIGHIHKRAKDLPNKLEIAREAMAMHWSDWHGLTQAIPPAYAAFIGKYALANL